ncbi:MAG TPA: 5-oxoprolinase subunit PxpB [Thermoanaerobaculia bacterium]|nr:5-oxoprolinase subunit PxpB [Thermoanaerobaculia bacterium]
MKVYVRELVQGSLLVEYPGASEDSANRAAVAAARALSGRPGLLDAIPGARTLFLTCGQGFDRAACERDLAGAAVTADATVAGRAVRIPVHYGGAAALDLAELARGLGVSPEEVARRHAAAAYRVAFLGFAPGFGYCVGLPEELHASRLSTPRTRVAAGTLAIGGSYTGVYPADTPGGWRLIGRSAARFFDPAGDPPTLLLPGDSVVFEPVGEETPPAGDRAAIAAGSRDGETPLFRVHSPGLFTSLQGAPGYGRGAFGVPAGGAMDPVALAGGNALVKKPSGAVALEMTLAGPELEVLADCRAAVAGAPMEAELNGSAVGSARPFDLRRGDRLRLARAASDVRAYLCVAGGLAVPPTQWQTLRLSKGDVVARADIRSAGTSWSPAGPRSADGTVRVVLGPQEDRFGSAGIAAFLSQPWRVSASSDRRGVRLEGDPIRHEGSAEIEPEGTAPGAIQVPADGRPIVLGPDRPVTGGYAKIATVEAADWPLVAQAGPGALLRFRAASPT